MLQTLSFKHKHPAYDLQGLVCQSIDSSHEVRVSGQDDEKSRERGWRTLENIFSPCASGHGASVLAFI